MAKAKTSSAASRGGEDSPPPQDRAAADDDVAGDSDARSDEDDDSYSDGDDDSSFSGSDYDDDLSMISSVAEDDGEDNGEGGSARAGGGAAGGSRPRGGRALLRARVRLTSGFFNGMVGTIAEAKRGGWYLLDEACGVQSAVRQRDFEVLTYGDGSAPGEDAGGREGGGEGGEGGENSSPSEQVSNSAISEGNKLIGAIVRVRVGKYAGLEGTVNECQSYRHVQVDVGYPIPPVEISHVKVLSPAGADDDNSRAADQPLSPYESKADLVRRYKNARVRILPPGDHAGTEGNVLKVIVGDWYITDNPEITKAYQAEKFEVLQYPPGLVGTSAARRAASSGGESGREAAAAVQDEGRARKRIKEEGEDAMTDESVAVTVSSNQNNSNVATAAITRREEEEHASRNLIGATIRITKGKFQGLIGTIRERQSIRHVQLDTVPPPLDFADVRVLRYADSPEGGSNSDFANDDFAKKYQKYVGAHVKVLSPEEYAGMEGMVIKVIVLGDWYIIDNEDVEMAFPEHKFEILRMPPGQTDEEKEEGGDVYGEEEEEDAKKHSVMGKSEEKDKEEEADEGNAKASDIKNEDVMNEGDGDNKVGADSQIESPVQVISNKSMDKELEDPVVVRNGRQETAVNEASVNTRKYSNTRKEVNFKHKVNDESKVPALKDEITGDKNVIEKGEFNALKTAQSKSNASEVSEKKKNSMKNNHISRNHDDSNDIEFEQEDESTPTQEDQGEMSNKSQQNDDDPHIGATAYVYLGPFRGLSGKLIKREMRGWWSIDNPEITKKVKCTQCKLVDDGAVDMDAIKEWYAGKDKSRMPSIIVNPDMEKEQKGGDYVSELETAPMFKRKIAGTDFTGKETWTKRRKEELGVIVESGTSTMSNIVNTYDDDNEDYNDNTQLNPVLLHLRNGGDRNANSGHLQLLPIGLRKLPPDTKIEIFNRRTGKIMSGDSAILLSDLPMALLDHAEYEPIVPPSSRNTSTTSRIGRSGPNVRVNSNVIPQSRVRASRVEGRDVLVTGGEYQGLSGTVDSCIPGGWYLVSKLFKNDDLNVVINSRNLELIPEKKAFANTSSSEVQSVDTIRIHLNAAKLRLEAFKKERDKLGSGGTTLSLEKDTVQLNNLEAEINKTNRHITDLKLALNNASSKST